MKPHGTLRVLYFANMIRCEKILDFTERIVREFSPHSIILFGSYAYGSPSADSDVDLMVVMPHQGDGYRKAAEISTRVGHFFPTDLIVRSPEVVRQRLALNDFFQRDVVERGIVLYDASDKRVGQKGRKRLQQRLASAKVAKDARPTTGRASTLNSAQRSILRHVFRKPPSPSRRRTIWKNC